LAYYTAHEGRNTVVTVVPGAAPRTLLDRPGSSQSVGMFSPDGKWLAYISTESGRDEIYVEPYPPPGVKGRRTPRGGAVPVWSADGREIFYRRVFSNAQLYRSAGVPLHAVSVSTEGGLGVGPERTLALEGFLVFYEWRDYDPTPDGRRFLLVYP